jgi:hypothetical protein
MKEFSRSVKTLLPRTEDSYSFAKYINTVKPRFTNRFSEHKASRMTYCVSSYEHASRQHRGAISWEYQLFSETEAQWV